MINFLRYIILHIFSNFMFFIVIPILFIIFQTKTYFILSVISFALITKVAFFIYVKSYFVNNHLYLTDVYSSERYVYEKDLNVLDRVFLSRGYEFKFDCVYDGDEKIYLTNNREISKYDVILKGEKIQFGEGYFIVKKKYDYDSKIGKISFSKNNFIFNVFILIIVIISFDKNNLDVLTVLFLISFVYSISGFNEQIILKIVNDFNKSEIYIRNLSDYFNLYNMKIGYDIESICYKDNFKITKIKIQPKFVKYQTYIYNIEYDNDNINNEFCLSRSLKKGKNKFERINYIKFTDIDSTEVEIISCSIEDAKSILGCNIKLTDNETKTHIVYICRTNSTDLSYMGYVCLENLPRTNYISMFKGFEKYNLNYFFSSTRDKQLVNVFKQNNFKKSYLIKNESKGFISTKSSITDQCSIILSDENKIETFIKSTLKVDNFKFLTNYFINISLIPYLFVIIAFIIFDYDLDKYLNIMFLYLFIINLVVLSYCLVVSHIKILNLKNHNRFIVFKVLFNTLLSFELLFIMNNNEYDFISTLFILSLNIMFLQYLDFFSLIISVFKSKTNIVVYFIFFLLIIMTAIVFNYVFASQINFEITSHMIKVVYFIIFYGIINMLITIFKLKKFSKK